LEGASSLAYYEKSEITVVKSFITLAPGHKKLSHSLVSITIHFLGSKLWTNVSLSRFTKILSFYNKLDTRLEIRDTRLTSRLKSSQLPNLGSFLKTETWIFLCRFVRCLPVPGLDTFKISHKK